MTPAEAIAAPGPARDLWAAAAVRERFRAGDLLGRWLDDNADATATDRREARRAVLSLQEAARPAMDAAGEDALRLPTDQRLSVLKGLGVAEARRYFDSVPEQERTEAEALLSSLLGGEMIEPDLNDRDRLATLTQVADVARAAGVVLPFDPGELQDRVERLDFLQMIGGPDLPRFVGRQRELKTLDRAWRSGQSATVLIEGPGGMGKSLLVSRFISDLLESDHGRPDAVFHLDFDRRDLQSARPAIVMAELVRQARRWIRRELSSELGRLSDYDASGDLESVGLSRSREVDATQNQADGLVALLGRGDLPCRIVIVIDSAEQVFGFDDVAAGSPHRVARSLEAAGAQVLKIYGSRAFPADFETGKSTSVIKLSQLSQAEATACLRAEAGVHQLELSEAVVNRVLHVVGRSPLAVRLASALLKSGKGQFDAEEWADSLKGHPERIQAALHDRILKRIRDPDVRKLARPGLLVRRLTAAVIAEVLAAPCDLDLQQIDPADLLERSAREGQLFVRDPSDPGALWHRGDVRALMLHDLDADIPEATAREINERAVLFYAGQSDLLSRVEELYHRLRLNQDEVTLHERWDDAAGERLKASVDELPSEAGAWVRTRLNAASLSIARGAFARLQRDFSNIIQSVSTAGDTPAPSELRGVVQRELQSGGPALATLARYGLDRLESELGDLYADALLVSGDAPRLLDEARPLLRTPDRAPTSIRPALFAASAGAFEGVGDLACAELFWNEARRAALLGPTGAEAERLAVGIDIGWLRTRRKLDRDSDPERSRHVRATLERLWKVQDGIPTHRVLLREAAAELGDALQDPELDPNGSIRRLTGILLEIHEAFPSAVDNPARTDTISMALMGRPGAPLAEISGLAMKYAYGSGTQAGTLVNLLREEVDWTLARAVSRPKLDARQGL